MMILIMEITNIVILCFWSIFFLLRIGHIVAMLVNPVKHGVFIKSISPIFGMFAWNSLVEACSCCLLDDDYDDDIN